jgi:hypothetical protein
MTLNSMVQDPSFIREDTSYRIYRAMGLVAPRTTYSWVTLNNADFGLYMNVESIDAQMLKRWLNPVHVYSSNCYLADITYSQSGCYDTNYGDSNRADLNAAIAVSVLNGQEWWTAVNKIADMTAVINLMATDIYTSNWDGYTDVVQNNYYIVFDDTGKLKIIPWGQDGTFPMQEDAQLDWLGRGPAFRNFGNQERSVMLRKCVAYTPCQAQLVRAQVAVKNKVATLDISGFKNKVASVINNAYISKETRSNSDVWSAIFWQDWLDTFFPQRTQALTAFLNTRSPEAPTLSMNGPSTVGSTLKAVASTWDYTATLSYQWLKNSQPIANATGIAISKRDVVDDVSILPTPTPTPRTIFLPSLFRPCSTKRWPPFSRPAGIVNVPAAIPLAPTVTVPSAVGVENIQKVMSSPGDSPSDDITTLSPALNRNPPAESSGTRSPLTDNTDMVMVTPPPDTIT